MRDVGIRHYSSQLKCKKCMKHIERLKALQNAAFIVYDYSESSLLAVDSLEIY